VGRARHSVRAARLQPDSALPHPGITMRFGTTILFVATVLTTAGGAVLPDGQTSPYLAIVQRNAFGLGPPPAIAAPPPKPSIPPPKITLTGITTILGRRMAFLTMPSVKPGEPVESFVLSEGQRANDIEVKNIDDKAGIVSIVNHGESQILDFDHDSAKPTDLPNNPATRQLIFPRSVLPPPARNEASLAPEEQTALIEIQRVKYQQENNPIHKILPTTEMTETPQN